MNQPIIKELYKLIPPGKIRIRNGGTFLAFTLFLIRNPRARDLFAIVKATTINEELVSMDISWEETAGWVKQYQQE